ncbi:MAG TPA: DUF5678 domain-containing protein [Candidatus Peribacteraceae bacterium]|nr:DUF5678 domain-containing protein [Candidatus Peribacteraceae bacterium]
MKYGKQHAGKWVAVKNEKVIAISTEFASLRKKISSRKDAEQVRFSLVPEGYITGVL